MRLARDNVFHFALLTEAACREILAATTVTPKLCVSPVNERGQNVLHTRYTHINKPELITAAIELAAPTLRRFYGLPLEKWSKEYVCTYPEGGYMLPHHDAGDVGGIRRTHALSICLNDDYEGGELDFPTFELTIKPKVGDAIAWPTSRGYIHAVKPVTKGSRHQLLTWFVR